MGTCSKIVASAIASLLLGCSTLPPNSVELKIESTPSSAAVFAPTGKMMGVTPFTLVYQLTPGDMTAGGVHGGNATAVWYSGARAVVNTDFRLNGLTSGTVTFTFNRPLDAPGVMQDVKFAEDRQRKESVESQAGWAAIGEVIAERNRQKAALPPLTVPDILKPPVQCTSTGVWPNQVVTTCK
jgi:hypothetical protein